MMARQNFAHRSGIKIHGCRQHGVWFNHRREFEALANWIQSGALIAASREQKSQQAKEERIKGRLIREGLDESSFLGREWI